MIDEAPGLAETDVELAKREASAEEITYAGSLATSERVERVMEARSGIGAEPLALQRMIAEIHTRAKERSRWARTV